MALVDFAPVARPSILSALARRLLHWNAVRGAARAKRLALDELLAMPEHRLRDLGIEPRSLNAAIDARFWPTRK